MIRDALNGIEYEFAVNDVFVPRGCFFVCPVCNKTEDMFISENPKCPTCNTAYAVSTGITYEDETNKLLRYRISSIEGRVLKITEARE
jgi:hypothetical protein